jgi:hypothetical protein
VGIYSFGFVSFFASPWVHFMSALTCGRNILIYTSRDKSVAGGVRRNPAGSCRDGGGIMSSHTLS